VIDSGLCVDKECSWRRWCVFWIIKISSSLLGMLQIL